MTKKEQEELIDAIRKTTIDASQSKKSALKFLMDAGIIPFNQQELDDAEITPDNWKRTSHAPKYGMIISTIENSGAQEVLRLYPDEKNFIVALVNKQNNEAAQQRIKACKHEHLHIGSGGYYIFCADCQAPWVAIQYGKKDADIDYSRQFATTGTNSWEASAPLTDMQYTGNEEDEFIKEQWIGYKGASVNKFGHFKIAMIEYAKYKNSPQNQKTGENNQNQDKKESFENNIETIKDNQQNACDFAEWLYNNRWFYFNNGIWNYTFEQGTALSDKTYEKHYRKTTQELYKLFLNVQILNEENRKRKDL